ncbi:MAG TPA: cyclic nucleotide-binding domain-containing protein [Actinomycetota bacterium]|jgi:CRP/FNR family transcriptional regulator, cyclic AMP receptor protein|nr:cyclic nucleotide-binding domain-containing protein [Actinomycetota bacterium]
MASNSNWKYLSEIPLFSNLSERRLRKLGREASEDAYEPGDVIVREDGRTRTLFVILEGSAKVVRKGRTIARRREGEFFGEISMIDGRRVASVVAETSMRCLILDHDDLRKLLLDDPSMAWELLKTLASRVRDA